MPRYTSTITVTPYCDYGGTIEATCTTTYQGPTQVLVQCYGSATSYDPVFEKYFPVVDGKATLGPLEGWESGIAKGQATLGYFTTVKGAQKWNDLAVATFTVGIHWPPEST